MNKLERQQYMKVYNAMDSTKIQHRKYRSSPYGRYVAQRAAAKSRNIPFLLTFDEWWEIWEPHWEHRGRKLGQRVMARNGDTGPYAVGNVSIVTNVQNAKDSAKNGKVAKGSKQGSAKLIEEDIPRIRDMLRMKVTQKDIGKWFCVSKSTIRDIKLGVNWSHI